MRIKKSNNINYLWIALFCCLFIMLMVFEGGFIHNGSANTHRPQMGILNLSEHDICDLGVISLSGDWTFYWRRLVGPDEPNSDGYAPVPGYWHNLKLAGQSLPGTGYATYKLKVITGTGSLRLRLRMQPISGAYTILVDDKVIAKSGEVSEQPDSVVTHYVPTVVSFDSPPNEFTITLHIANPQYKRGGIWYPIYFGTAEKIEAVRLYNSEKEMLIFGGILMILLYHLFIYLLRRKDLSYLYIVMLSAGVLTYMLVSGEFYLFHLLTNTSLEVGFNLLYLLYFWGVPLFSGFIMQVFPSRRFGAVQKLLLILALLSTIATVISVNTVYPMIKPFYDIVIAAGIVLILLRIIMAIKHELPGAVTILVATLVFFFTAANDILYQNGIYLTPFTELLPIATFCLLLCQSFVIAKVYAQNFTRIEQLSEQLIALDKRKDEFLIKTAHQLKAPLQGALNLIHVVSESEGQKITPGNKNNLNFIARILRRLSGLIDDITDLQMLRENRIKADIKVFDCRGAIEAVLYNLHYLAEEKGLALINTVPIGQFFVKADENRFVQILYNLISNAIQFTQSGYVQIEAGHENDYIYITVTDTGLGISGAIKEYLFSGVPIENYENSAPHGLGVGLTVAYQLALLMGGDLYVKWTHQNKGSCLELKLPASVGKPSHQPQVMNYHNLEENTYTACENKKEEHSCTILLVDDDSSNSYILKEVLKKNECSIITARTGGQAVDILNENRGISMVLLNSLLPDITGYQICRKIREKYSLYELPVIFLVVRSTQEEIRDGLAAGANDFIKKPFVSDELSAKIQTHLALKNSIKKAVDTEVLLLQSQIKPHFIYNALSVITGLCYIDGGKAGDLMVQFGNYLRKTFDVNYRTNQVTLSEEISLICSYVELEKARFGDRVTVIYEIEAEALKCKIPSLILQPLVENAIRHGILKRNAGGTVLISAGQEDGILILRVEDDGVGMTDERLSRLLRFEDSSPGVALRNINRRMMVCYNRPLEITSKAGKGTKAVLRISV